VDSIVAISTGRLKIYDFSLTSEEQELSAREGTWRKPKELEIWACNHCNWHLDDYKTFSEVEEHAKTKYVQSACL
jgi:hypothetical protein